MLIRPWLATISTVLLAASGQTSLAGPTQLAYHPIVADTAAAIRAEQLARAQKAIAGRESEPAEAVFKNIQTFKGVPAGRVLAIMDIGYSRSLGVTCARCHVVDQYEREDSTRKAVTRQMAAMSAQINNDLLKKIDGIRNPNPVINCTTCHRGNIKPALNLDTNG